MNTKIELTGKWCHLRSDQGSLSIQSFKRSSNEESFRALGERILSELNSIEKPDEMADYASSEEFHPITMVFETQNQILLKSDIVRSVPLFYTNGVDTMHVTDRLSFNNDYEVNQEAIYEFVETNYVSGSDTFYSHVNGIQAAEIIQIMGGRVEMKERYFVYNVDQPSVENETLNIPESSRKLDKIFLEVFREVIDSLPDGGRIVVPLSGGHDSRIIVNYLYKLGFKDVICFSYGMPGNRQSEISRQVAEALNYEWHFIEYTEGKWYELHQTGDFDRYVEFACNGVSNPHLQDFLAVYELKKDMILKKGDVFLPGHGLDMLCNNMDHTIYDCGIIEASMKRYSRSEENAFKDSKKFVEKMKQIQAESGVRDSAFLDYLLWQERQAKFTINSFRVYEYFGYEARATFWDNRLVNYWLSVPRELKFTRDFLIEAEKDVLLAEDLKEIPYAKERNVNAKKDNSSKKEILPHFLKIILLRMTGKKQYQNEGLNLIYAGKADTVKKLVSPLNSWPSQAANVFSKDLYRYPFQINHTFLTRLYTVSVLYRLSKQKNVFIKSLN